jgi:rhamnosyl/mannosyltransferase
MSSVDGRLLIAGQGPLEASLVRLRNTLGLQDRVIFLANLSDEHLRAYYHAAAVFALASVARSEAFGIVQLEAMAAGTPVVNTNLPSGVPFVSRHGETGLTVPPKDVDALARAINGLLDNETLRRQYGTAGRARVETFFTAKGMSDKTLEIYQEVIGACRMEVHPDMPVRAGR